MNMANSKGPVIEVRDLVVEYGARTILDGISFTVRRGEVFVILGGSGCGKSTLLRVLIGLIRPGSGTVVINGEDFTAMAEEEQSLVRKRMGMCFQTSALFNSMSIGDNVALALREHTDLEESTIEIMTKIKLELVGLAGFQDYLPAELSGGMKKRAGLARAMAMDPEIILYDEPSAGLDPITAAGLDQLIRKMQLTFGLTSIVVTHDLESVKLIADTVCVLDQGKVLGIGTFDELGASGHAFIEQFFSRRPNPGGEDNSAYVRSLTGFAA